MSIPSDEEIISPRLAQELDSRIAKANGDILAVRHELEEQLHALEHKADRAPNPEAFRQDIVLILSQIEYLDLKLRETNQPVVEKHVGLAERLRHLLGRHAEDAV